MRRKNLRKEAFLKESSDKLDFFIKNDDLVTFSFKYFTSGENAGEEFEDWQKEEILADLNNKLKSFSNKKKRELLSDRTLEIYRNGYPVDSVFTKPKVLESLDLEWARLEITGKRRLIGFFVKPIDYRVDLDLKQSNVNIFYIVFLDKNHLFAPSRKKHT